MSEIDFVLDLFFENRGRIERLQKLAYEKAAKEKHSLLETFRRSYFGQYSGRLSDLVQTLIATGFLDVKWFGEKKRYFLTDDGLFVHFSKVREED